MNSRACCANQARGFTLIEMLLAMTLLSLVMVILVNALQLSATVSGAVVQSTDDMEEFLLMQQFLRNQLEQARPIMVRIPGESPKIGFSGEENKIEFLAPMPSHGAVPGIYWFSVEIEETEAGKQLTLASRAYGIDDSAVAPNELGQKRVLYTGFEKASFGYLAERRHAKREWVSRWNETDSLPLLVRLRLWKDVHEPDSWRQLVVAPKIGML